jgi:phosphoribosyl-AMP cyclohydrolase / phosphoribosyl-ATP pyrophosphohydrolase
MKIDFEKNVNLLIPAIIQDYKTKTVLMLGYMNRESYNKTVETNKVTFFSRSKKRLWTKGEESGHFLEVIDIKVDCDSDTLLIKVNPNGPVCHTLSDTCWNEKNNPNYGFISKLEQIISNRIQNISNESYVSTLVAKGINKIAQKLGEEAVEVIIESKDTNPELFLNECADMLFHYLILLQAKDFSFDDVVQRLSERNKNS